MSTFVKYSGLTRIHKMSTQVLFKLSVLSTYTLVITPTHFVGKGEPNVIKIGFIGNKKFLFYTQVLPIGAV